MDAKDYAEIDSIFAELEAREQLAVERAARAAFARGEIAEQKVRWHDAAAHCTRAAELDATAMNIHKPQLFLQKAGDYPAAAYWGENSPPHATCVNNLAALYDAMGQRDEAGPLYQQPLKILEATLAAEHPTTQTVRKNYETFQSEGGPPQP